MNKMFHIKIFVIEEFTEIEHGDWTRVDSKEVERDTSFHQSEDEPRTRVDPVYGYTPDRSVTKKTEREIFSQVVEELDLRQVIAAINDLTLE